MAHKFIPVPDDELWACLQCDMNLGRNTTAQTLLIEGEPGQRGTVKTGICGNHAENLNLEDLREAQRKFREASQ
jgi:hypothetical protein